MKTERCCADKARLAAYVVGILGSFLIVAVLVKVMHDYAYPAPLGADRAELRRKNLADLKAANAEVLNLYAWQDQAKGVVRLPVERALELTVQEWQNPAAARSNLIDRAEKANVAPPKPPEPKSIFE